MAVKSYADSSPLFTTLHTIDFSAVYKGNWKVQEIGIRLK